VLTSNLAFSQLYVENNAYIFINDVEVYVEDDINLFDAASTIYLRNEAQIIQGSPTVPTGNSGIGKLSVYQDGTVNNFAYNYWCSPVGNTDAINNANRPFRPNNNIYDHIGDVDPLLDPITSSLATYTGGANGTSGPLVISTTWLYSYDPGLTYVDWDYIGSTGTVAPGYGFTMKGTGGSGSNQKYDFRGKPNNGTISVNVEAGRQTLVGNPYPSALDARAFIHDPLNTPNLGIDPANTTGTLYFWEQDATTNSHSLVDYRGGYASYTIDATGTLESYVPATFNSYNGDGTLNTAGGVRVSPKTVRRYIPIGQGFMIEGETGIVGTQQVYFTNAQRAYQTESGGNSEFFKTSQSKHAKNTNQDLKYFSNGLQIIPEDFKRFRINVDFDDTYTRQLLHNFHDSATDGFDYGLESKINSDVKSDVNWILNDEAYVTQASKFDEDLKIPIVLILDERKDIRFRIFDVQHFNNDQPIYLHDIEKNTYSNLRAQNFEINLDAGNYEDRFEITFTAENLLNTDKSLFENLKVIQNNKISVLQIFNPNEISIQSFSLYDASGKRVINQIVNASKSNQMISTKSFSDGVYIIEIQTNNNSTFRRKILISNRK
jgi:hypothetical protein